MPIFFAELTTGEAMLLQAEEDEGESSGGAFIDFFCQRSKSNCNIGMDQYLLIPFLGEWTSINPSYFDVNYRGTIGFDTLPYADQAQPRISLKTLPRIVSPLRPTSAATGCHVNRTNAKHKIWANDLEREKLSSSMSLGLNWLFTLW